MVAAHASWSLNTSNEGVGAGAEGITVELRKMLLHCRSSLTSSWTLSVLAGGVLTSALTLLAMVVVKGEDWSETGMVWPSMVGMALP